MVKQIGGRSRSIRVIEANKPSEMEIVIPEKGVPQYLSQSAMLDPVEWVGDIVLWDPIYLKDYGNCCRVAQEDGGRAYFYFGSLRILREIAEYYAIDYHRMRDKYRDFVEKSQWPPLVVASRDEVFFAIKTRVPREKNDGATGYVADSAILHLETLTSCTTRIHLRNGLHVDALESRKCLTIRRNNAVLFKRQLQEDGIIPRR
jgi:hypothetical protein